MLRALSTACCPLPSEPRTLLGCWQALCAGQIAALAIDGRLDPQLQAELLTAARASGIVAAELAHSRLGRQGRPAASPLSDDPDERRAALEQIADTLRLAGEHGIERVLLMTRGLRLSWPRGLLAARHARRLSPVVPAPLLEERQALAAPALDHLCLVLDGALALASTVCVSLLLPAPAAWPDQLPSLPEVERLLQLFAGAPLRVCYGSDWAHLAGELGGEEGPPPRGVPAVSSLRLADASGLRQRLPPGTGEVRWGEVLKGAKEIDQVLAPGPEVRHEEIRRAVELLDAITAE